MVTMAIPDFLGNPQTVEKPLAPGRAAAAASKSIAWSTEDKAVMDDIAAKIALLYNHNRATYVAAVAGYAAYATPTDIFSIFGSATKTIAITRLAIGIQSTAAALQTIFFVKRSSANTVVAPTAMTKIPNDSASPAPTATLLGTYASAPTLGSSLGNVRIGVLASGTLTGNPGFIGTEVAGTSPPASSAVTFASPIILRGVAEGLCLNYGGAALTAGFVATILAEWIEY